MTVPATGPRNRPSRRRYDMVVPTAGGTGTDTGTGADTPGAEPAAVLPTRPTAAQAHALRAAAALVEQAGIAGLALSVNDDRITIQVPERLDNPRNRTAAVAMLAAAAHAQLSRDTEPAAATHGWIRADGCLAGHPVHIFTPMENTP